jgi:hypothetical protein
MFSANNRRRGTCILSKTTTHPVIKVLRIISANSNGKFSPCKRRNIWFKSVNLVILSDLKKTPDGVFLYYKGNFMRNTLTYPVTSEEIVACLNELNAEISAPTVAIIDGVETNLGPNIGDMRPLLLSFAAKIVAEYGDDFLMNDV